VNAFSHEVADARYDMKPDDGHTFLFVVDDDICIDAGVGGNPARFINHKCDANCETIIDNKRVFIDAIRTIEPARSSATIINSPGKARRSGRTQVICLPVRRQELPRHDAGRATSRR
jgi:hypothetical protein